MVMLRAIVQPDAAAKCHHARCKSEEVRAIEALPVVRTLAQLPGTGTTRVPMSLFSRRQRQSTDTYAEHQNFIMKKVNLWPVLGHSQNVYLQLLRLLASS